MLKMWLIRLFFGKRILLENILLELRNIHWHLDEFDGVYKKVHKIKEKKEKEVI